MGREKKIDFELAMKNQTILRGLVRMCNKIEESDGTFREEILVETGGAGVIIEKDEVGIFPFEKSLRHLVGEEVSLVIIDVIPSEKLILGSIKKALEIKNAPVIKSLEEGEVLQGVVMKTTKHGAYILVGEVHGFMKNSDFSDDGSEIRDYYPEMSKMKVKFHKYTANGHILFRPERKRHGSEFINSDKIMPGQTFLGKIIKIFSDTEYVNIAPGIDCKCYNNPNIDLGMMEVNMPALVQVKKVYRANNEENGKLKIKGEIKKLLPKNNI